MTDETSGIRAILGEVTDALEAMVWHHCAIGHNDEREIATQTLGIDANDAAVRLLVRLGRLERTIDDQGRHMFSRAVPQKKPA